ncbi:nitrophenyl compound nitroreductase subunit ArsF family protein [Maribellus maritimus]|uniref:nitrophenyl compound nitroreductase subunit ArsF family protein n=1 Tax=Maribellus maritimus TaxID=2870838 RepID=UPI001EEC4571|nr:nitrophenyl compound nitroreductase subunit ArsF family protein [Maribellus maritimus]MCG6189235.1 nitrophenyl compound nitroreductase subunit ArsF family protein [Maribellus maritimus]
MKTIKSFAFFLIAFFICLVGNANSGAIEKVEKEKTVVYYFHNTRRCPTCMAIEKETKKVLEDSFAESVGKGDIVFKAYNAEEAENRELVKKMNVTGSALIIVKDGEKYDLTSKGFMYALKQPEKLRKALWEILVD